MIIKDSKELEINRFQNITVEIDPFAVNIEDQFIISIMEFISAILNLKMQFEEFEKVQDQRRSINAPSL
jgi:hypothetical protein